eukprot:8181722-Alexandrium_andersonii.AAC.1
MIGHGRAACVVTSGGCKTSDCSVPLVDTGEVRGALCAGSVEQARGALVTGTSQDVEGHRVQAMVDGPWPRGPWPMAQRQS